MELLQETGSLPSVFIFAECISSDTRQTSSLPSAAKKTLGKIIALGKQTLCRVLKKNTRQRSKFVECFFCTRQISKFAECFFTLGKEISFSKYIMEKKEEEEKRFAECS